MKILSRVFMTMLMALYATPSVGMSNDRSSDCDNMDWAPIRPAAPAPQNQVGANDYRGTVTIAAGTLTVPDAAFVNGQLNGQLVVLAGGTLRLADQDNNVVEELR
jgi:hypothetical protein